MIWVVRSADAQSQVAAQWLVQRFIDPEASFSSPYDLSLSKRRNGAAGALDLPVNRAFAELTSFDHLLKQHRLATDPALLFLSDVVRSPHFLDFLDYVGQPALRPPALACSDLAADRKEQAFALLDTFYEWLREQVQNDLNHS